MSYPAVELNEEGMREGMQIESVTIGLDDKVRLLNALSSTGLKNIMVGSFVSPRYTPQMSEIDQLVRRFTPAQGVHYRALALNQKGRDRAAEHMPPLTGSRFPPTTMVHLCDTFIRRNANISQQFEIDRWTDVVEGAKRDGASEGGLGLGAAWGSNFTGHRSLADRIDMLEQQSALWESTGIPVTTLSLADPMSWCMPDQVEETLTAVLEHWPDIDTFHLHLHDARGMALPSIYAALRVLDHRHTLVLDTTFGGIGGCPYCGNGRATGMAATEDVVHMLEHMGIDTGVDLSRLIDAVWLLDQVLGRSTPGKVSTAGPFPSSPDELYSPNLPLVETHDEAKHFKRGEASLDHQSKPWREPIPDPEPTAIKFRTAERPLV
ncbi:hypothetical protein [Rhodococcoides fascians]|uniref:hypothetical protein n=1 Tax=Rhodococcoides fascians TaxID=1828 RepID=UPI00056A7B1C|nr:MULTISPECIES: hypothetical protein [Rhodococcus]OZF01380.1 hypothetical protein CH301_11660 [Rhodococcus sp. 15-1189-1-1a]OZF15550.1 hypothetical protein CH299_12210 [Rhodococcus sp. 14-2686-1-2]